MKIVGHLVSSRLVVAVLLALAVAPAVAAPPVAAPSAAPPEGTVRLAPHRAVYDLSLVSSRGMRGIESAQGRIAFDFTGNACDGYGLKFRQVTVVQSAESGRKLSDLRTASFESGDGRSFRFRTDTAIEGTRPTSIDGTAERRGAGPLAIRLKRPRRQSVSTEGGAVFPNAQMRDLIAAAREGRRTLSLRLFDGSDDGRKVYETLAVIGAPVMPSPSDGLEEAARQDGLARLRRWPVTLSYFSSAKGDQVPVYVLGFDLYDNGVSRALRLDYGDFVLKGDMTRLELLPERSGCQR